ncbi:MAG: hypothetical protein PVH41_01130 [Anaerolineae bacterium]|jgi:hypothetical protein
MIERRVYWSIDLVAVAVANLTNIAIVVVFLLRTTRIGRLWVGGLVWMALALLLAIVVALNIRMRRDWWATLLPLLLIVFLVVEVALDYVTRYDFRNTALLVPYLMLYYLSILGMIGYAFLVRRDYGYVTLATYFLSQVAALYSYLKVRHG